MLRLAGLAALAALLLLTGSTLAVATTPPGQGIVARLIVRALTRAVNGRVTIGSVSGTLWRAAELRDVTLALPDGAAVIHVQRVRVHFAITDLIRSRYRFSDVEVDRPEVVLEQSPDGKWNVERLFGQVGPPGAATTRRPLVEIRSARVVDGTLIVRERKGGDTVVARRVDHLAADLARLRLSHPDSAAIVAVFRSMAAQVTNPNLEVRKADGMAELAGDSLRFAFAHVAFPGTAASASGTVRWGRARTRLEAAVSARTFRFDDVRSLVPLHLPASGGGRIDLHFRLGAEGGADFDIASADLNAGRSQVSAGGRVMIGRDGAVSLGNLDAQLGPLDLAVIGLYADTVPVHGLVRGHVTADGPLSNLAVTSDVRWQDEDAPGGGGPNAVVGRGRLAIGGERQVAFSGFALSRADVAVATIRRFASSVDLPGRLRLAGVLDGPWRDASFRGTLIHADTGDVATQARGTVRLGIRDTVRLDADLDVDALSLDLLRRRYPAIPFTGTLSGRAHVHGPVTALALDVALGGPPLALTARGMVGSRDRAVAVQLAGTFDSLDLEYAPVELPASAVAGVWAADLEVPKDDPLAATGTARVTLRPGVVAGVELAAGQAALTLDAGRVGVDSARLAFEGGALHMVGALGRGGGLPGRLEFAARADTVAYLEPLVRWLLRSTGDSGMVRLDGNAQLTGHVEGTTRGWRLEFAAAARGAQLGDDVVRNLSASGRLERGDAGYRIRAAAAADTLRVFGLLYAAVGATAAGPLDSLAAAVSAGFHVGSGLRAALRVTGTGAARSIRLDSLDLELPARSWRLAHPTGLSLADSALTVDSLELLPRAGSGRLLAAGVLRRRGAARFDLTADSVPLVDLYAVMQRDTAGVSGAVQGTVRLSGSADAPVIDAAGQVVGGQFGDYRLPLLRVGAQYRDRRLTLDGGVWRDSARLVTVSGSLPIDLRLVAAGRRLLPGPLSITARADSLDLTVARPLTDIVTDLAGGLSLDVRIAGTWDAPTLAGEVDVWNGAVRVPSLGARYTDIDARLALDTDVVQVTRASARGAGGGRVDVGGQIRFESLSRPVLDLTITASQFAAFDIRTFGALTASGTLALKGPAIGATLSGIVNVDAGSLQFKDLVEKRVVSLDDPEFQALVDTNLARAAELGPPVHTVFVDSLRIENLTVALGDNVWLRSSEANIQLDGAFGVRRSFQGSAPRYRLDGTLHAVRGSYRLTLGKENSFLAITRDFRVSSGTVRFFGTPDFNPELDITAEHVVRTAQGTAITMQARIGGTLLAPELHLSSDAQPPLTETEIVSYLMFGQPPSVLSQSGAGGRSEAALAQAVGSSLVGGVGQALVTELGLPLDYLTIVPGTGPGGPQGVSTARVEAGAQLGERTFLTLNAGLCEVLAAQLVGATLEYRLGGRWTASAAFEPVVQECGTSAGLAGLAGRKQFGFDLFWQQGIR